MSWCGCGSDAAAAADAPVVKTRAFPAPAGSKQPVPAGIWAELATKLPTAKTDEEKAKRAELFSLFDPNGNGYLSLAEVDKGIKDILQIDDMFDCKPAIMRAFQAAKACSKSEARLGEDFVEKHEFRLLLVYLRLYFELFQMFDRVDADDDRRIDIDEFKAGLDKIAAWGVTVDDPEGEFATIDQNGGGIILFDEFCDWAIRRELDLEDDDE